MVDQLAVSLLILELEFFISILVLWICFLDSIPFIGIMRMRRGVATVKIGIEIRVCRASSRSARAAKGESAGDKLYYFV